MKQTFQTLLAQTMCAAASLVFATSVSAAGTDAAPAAHDHASHDHGAPTENVLVDGTIKKIDAAGSKVTIAHAALPNGMPAMTMAFRVKDARWLTTFKDGQKIRFSIDAAGTTVVRMEPAR